MSAFIRLHYCDKDHAAYTDEDGHACCCNHPEFNPDGCEYCTAAPLIAIPIAALREMACPNCFGKGEVRDYHGMTTTSHNIKLIPCPTCKGTKVITYIEGEVVQGAMESKSQCSRSPNR